MLTLDHIITKLLYDHKIEFPKWVLIYLVQKNEYEYNSAYMNLRNAFKEFKEYGHDELIRSMEFMLNRNNNIKRGSLNIEIDDHKNICTISFTKLVSRSDLSIGKMEYSYFSKIEKDMQLKFQKDLIDKVSAPTKSTDNIKLVISFTPTSK